MMRPRLTANDLAAAYDECPTPAMRRVLWEIARLQSTIKRAAEVRRMVGNSAPPGVDTFYWSLFCDDIDHEPCLTDGLTPRQQQRIAEGVAKSRARAG